MYRKELGKIVQHLADGRSAAEERPQRSEYREVLFVRKQETEGLAGADRRRALKKLDHSRSWNRKIRIVQGRVVKPDFASQRGQIAAQFGDQLVRSDQYAVPNPGRHHLSPALATFRGWYRLAPKVNSRSMRIG